MKESFVSTIYPLIVFYSYNTKSQDKTFLETSHFYGSILLLLSYYCKLYIHYEYYVLSLSLYVSVNTSYSSTS